ncbi:uncharacterized protein LOC119068643 [Bradysia coprophila]|uniref:uncharacterized protein LOC119068643 n=1 Tax=Bradysia coprophila TaxID=38358 RepID=UPI00187DD27D|nr:uncharacterized protein LOC119068643 [Bradysia coprophila]
MNTDVDDPVKIIQISLTDNLEYIRTILEPNNQQTYFEKHRNVAPEQLQILGTVMLFCSLEQNSDLVYGSLKHLNTLHKFYPDIRFHYNKQLVEHLRFDSCADNFAGNFLTTLYSCAESTFNGARQETLEFFKYWIQDEIVALDVFGEICYGWPWTNRNKYYLLAILFERHNFYNLLKRHDIDATYFVRGVVISLQYRNLIAPGQSLIVQLVKLNIVETFNVIADVLRYSTDFELYNCVQWLHCISNLKYLYDRLDLANGNIFTDAKFGYLFESNMEKLVLFRRTFKVSFEKHPKIGEIDRVIVSKYQTVRLVHRAAIFEVLITNTMTRLDAIEENLCHLQNFLKDNMSHEHSALRQDIMKLLPNLFYLLTSLLRSATDERKSKIKSFFQFLKLQIFDIGIGQEQYQPLIFSLRLYAILMKLLFGCRQDRLIKEFNVDKNKRLRSFLIDENVWDPCSAEHCNTLIDLVQSEFDDVRDISTELLVRFFPTNAIGNRYHELMTSTDIQQCRYSHLFARIAMQNDESQLQSTLKQFLNSNESDYNDPFRKANTGNHLFGAVNCLNEFYCFRKDMAMSGQREKNSTANTMTDITAGERITNHFLLLLKTACPDEAKHGSPSFEKMDESLELLLSRSAQPVTDLYEDKKFLLLSLWLTLKACSELAANISSCTLDGLRNSSGSDYSSKVEILTKCLNIASNVLLHTRHKGAIEASGLSLGKIVRSITINCGADTQMFDIVTSCVEKIFNVIDKTDTTRRGAGLSIMVLHLVKNDCSKDKTIVKHVMGILLRKYDLAVQLQQEHQNRDNLQASILHFFCVLFKDGDLKATLSGYMVDVFSIAIAKIESSEWTIRNAALQLFGAIVPKLVGQTQYFVNAKISWEPVNTSYNDIIAKMIGIHQHVLHIIDGHTFSGKSSILLVSVLELLSRVEVIGQSEDIRVLHAHFFTMINFDSEKIRNLAAKSLARFHEFYEIQPIVEQLLPQLFESANENSKHGIVISVLYLLQKYESDVRFTGKASLSTDLFSHTRTLVSSHFRRPIPTSYYVRCYLLTLLLFIGFDIFDAIVSKMIFECETVRRREDVEKHLMHLDAQCEYSQFGFDLWKQKIQNVYLDCELREEWEI